MTTRRPRNAVTKHLVLLAVFLFPACATITLPCRDARTYTPSTDAQDHTFQAIQCADSIIAVIGNLQKP